MVLSLRSLQKLQRDTGFNINFLEKVHHITRILSGIFSHKQIKENVALKGGTALNFIYLDVPRLSVDLDLNFIGAVEKEEMLRKRAEVSKEILKLADSLGYKVSKRPESYIMERLLLKYRMLSGLSDSIRLEINYLDRVPVIKIIHKTFDHIFDLDDSDLEFMESLKSGKLNLKILFGRLDFNPRAEKHPPLIHALSQK